MDRRSYIVVLYKGARMMLKMIMDEKITYDGIMFSKDDKPIYYTDLLNSIFVQIEKLLDEMGINEIMDKSEVK